MRWQVKAFLQMAASQLPCSERLNYLGQKVLMGRHRDPRRSVADRFQRARWYAETWRAYSPLPLSAITHLEIGTGWSLAVPLSLWCLGLERQITVDIARLAHLDIVNRAIEALRNLEADMPRRPSRSLRRLDDLEEFYGICYWAPCDARRLNLPAETVDWVTSTLTLQHIPVPVLRAILDEFRRILKTRGLLMSYIDYADNYAYTDRSVTVYNFLQFTEKQWRWFNPSLHYQNRLRHVQYQRLFRECGFSLIEEAVNRGTEKDLRVIQAMRLAPEFASFRAEDLAIRSSRIAAVRAEAGFAHTHASGCTSEEGY